MSCSSCQQNNHISNSTTEDSLCECACGCAEPTCPTPQPCTEITDARCIIYTQAAIKCGNDTVVTTNASASTALTQIVTYFCNKITGSLIPDDIICNEEIIVNAGATVQDAIADIISYFCDKFNNTVEGSGLNNYLARWTPDGNTLGYGLIQDNGTRLGIGIAPQVNFFLVTDSTINEYTFKSINRFAGSGSGRGVTGDAQGACLGNNYGVHGSATGALNSNVGGWFVASGNNPCSVRLSDGTQGVGKFLKSIDNIGSANWVNITSADVSGVVAGSGTLNYVAKWTPNGTTLGNSLIQDNGTSIGINTNPASHPSYKLVVYGSGANSSGGLRVVNTTTAGLTNQAVYGAVIESEFTTTNLTITNAVGLLSSSTGGNTTNIGIQSNVNGSFAIGGSFNAGIISFISGNGNIVDPTNYGIYSYVSAVSSLNPSIGHYVNVRQNTGGGGRYSVQLIDGTEGVGKFLKSTDAFGKANWANITAADVSGVVSGSGTLNYLSKWTPNGTTLGNSLIQDNGTTIAINSVLGPATQITAATTLNYGFSLENNSTATSTKIAFLGETKGVSAGQSFGISGYGEGSTHTNVGVKGNSSSSGTAKSIAGQFIAAGTTTGGKYSLQLQDGTHTTAGRFLKNMDTDGRANWANITTADVENLQKEITTAYTLTDVDDNYTIFINNGATPITISLGAITKANFCVGFIQEGSADVTFVGATNPVGLKLKGQGYQAFIERKLSTATYYLLGNTKV